MKVYVSGPMTGIPQFNAPAFRDAAATLRALGLDVVDPSELCVHLEAPTWSDCMRIDLAALLECDAVVVLPGWEESRGASLECRIARELSMPVVDLARAVISGIDAIAA